jgi:hypothetical protein
MRKLVESTFVTLDGVISDPQNWGPPYWGVAEIKQQPGEDILVLTYVPK